MDSSQRILQTNGKLFFKFVFGLGLRAENRKIFKQIERREHFLNFNGLSISMDLSRRALRTDEKLFPNFEFVFLLLAESRE